MAEQAPETIFLQMTDDEVDEMVSVIKTIDPTNPTTNIGYFRHIRNMANAKGVFFDYRKQYIVEFDWLTSCARFKEKT